MTQPRNLRLALSLALALVVVALGGLSVARKIHSFQALGFEAIPEAGGAAVSSVEDPATGLKPRDEILQVNGGDANTWDQLRERLRERPTSKVTAMRGDQLVQVSYKRPPLQIDFPYLIFCLMSVVYLALGLYTLLRQKDGQGFLFYLWCLTSAALYLLSPSPPAGLARTLIYLGDEAARLLLPALTLHLFLVFPTPLFETAAAAASGAAEGTARWIRRSIPFFYLPAAAMMGLQLDMVLNHGHMIFGKVNSARLAALDRIELLYFAVVLLAAIGVLAWRLRRGAAWEQHRQMQWMAWGVACGYIPFLTLYFAPLALHLRPSQLLTSAAVLPLALVPLTFAYAVLRYKLWDIEVIVRDTISLTLTLLLGIIGFSLVDLAINHGVSKELSLARNLLSFLSGLGIAGLLVPTRGAISSALERIHYRDTFGKRKALTGLGRELLQERDLGKLCSALLDRIQEAVDVETTNLYLLQGEALAVIRPEPGLPGRVPLDVLGLEFWTREFERLSGVAMPAEFPMPGRLFAAGYRYAFPLTVRGRGIGIAIAGFKRDHMPLNSEDTDLIRHLLTQAALAIENAQLVGQLQLQLEEVRQLQSYTEGIFESSPAGIAVLDGERRLQSANSAFAGIVGRGREEIAGLSLEAVLPVQPLPSPGEGAIEARWSDDQGRERHLQLSLAAFEHGWRQGLYVLVVHDVSERVAMENALHEKDRMAALGMLAAGVAHEVNTPITGISSYAQMLLQDTAPSDPHYDILKKVERQTFRASRIVNNLLEHARNRQKEQTPVAVAPLVSECLDLLAERLSQSRIALQWTQPQAEDSRRIQVLGCDGELQQVFTNLIVNAIDAMHGAGGRLTVELSASDTLVTLRVRDTGPGVPADKLEMIFQPFYSTKLSRGGTGLGLSISTEIVQRHGGTLRVVSPAGEGACFLVELPRYQPPAQANA